MDQELLKWFPVAKWIVAGVITIMVAAVGVEWHIATMITEMNDRQKANEQKIEYIIHYLEQNGANNFGAPFIPGVSFNQAPDKPQDAALPDDYRSPQ